MGLPAGGFNLAGAAEGGEEEESRLAGAGALSQERQPALDSAAGRSWKMIPRPLPPPSSLLSPPSILLAPLGPTC